MEQISVFDIFKISVGPSSSHTMGPWRAAESFIKKTGTKKIKSLKVLLFGSLAKTGKGHGTDIAVLLGLHCYNIETIEVEKINDYISEIKTKKQINPGGKYSISFDPETDIEFIYKNLPKHPNALSFVAIMDSGETMEETYYSIGGGFIIQEEGPEQKKEERKLPYPIENASELLNHIEKNDLSIYEIVLKNELTWRDEKTVHRDLKRIWEVMLECIYRGCHTPGTLPGGLNVQRRAANMTGDLLPNSISKNPAEWIKNIKAANPTFANVIKWVSCFALAVNEENASFGRVVTAPTNGAAGVIPAVLMYYLCFCENKGDEDISKFLLTAGEIGSLFKKGATISAAMGGCQAEIGVSSAMAAGALTFCMGGSDKQTMMAAEIAMEHHLGLTCDPINGLVQIPCIERNTMGAIKAITASQIALSSDPEKAKVSLESVIKTMKATAFDMKDKYKETSEGGLAINVSVNLPEC
ncbi:MAG: L-serine ammonia-lyase [Bacteroidota bacterium]